MFVSPRQRLGKPLWSDPPRSRSRPSAPSSSRTRGSQSSRSRPRWRIRNNTIEKGLCRKISLLGIRRLFWIFLPLSTWLTISWSESKITKTTSDLTCISASAGFCPNDLIIGPIWLLVQLPSSLQNLLKASWYIPDHSHQSVILPSSLTYLLGGEDILIHCHTETDLLTLHWPELRWHWSHIPRTDSCKHQVANKRSSISKELLNSKKQTDRSSWDFVSVTSLNRFIFEDYQRYNSGTYRWIYPTLDKILITACEGVKFLAINCRNAEDWRYGGIEHIINTMLQCIFKLFYQSISTLIINWASIVPCLGAMGEAGVRVGPTMRSSSRNDVCMWLMSWHR